MGFILKKLLDTSICLFNQCGCLRHDKGRFLLRCAKIEKNLQNSEHSLREFNRCAVKLALADLAACTNLSVMNGQFWAYRLADGLPVAVKSIRHKRINGWTLTERRMIPTEICFIEECQDVKGVVRLIGWFANRRGFLIVMERPVNFMDLFDLISTFGWVEERMARGLFVQIVDTVAELYKRHSVIHRDIKDENVVVDLDSGTVWLVDFGAAELLERAKKQRFQGTMSYSPPEVFKRESFLPLEGTVWSLGILLYLLVVGKPPFRNELQICTGKLRFPRTLSSECRALIHRCLCPSPEGRISLEELQQSEWIRDNDAMDTFSSDFEAQWRRRRRRKRHGSLNSNSLHAPSDGDEDSDEDCSYRTEVGAVPGPLTIPAMSRGISIAHRSPTTSSSFVEQNSHSPMEEGAKVAGFSDPKDQQDTSQLLMGTTADILCSSISSSSLAMSEMGFETAPEYDEWNYASFSSSSLALSRDEISDKNAAFHQPNSIEFCSHSERNHSLANSSVPFVQIAFCATQSDGESAVCSFCSFYSSSSDSEERRRNSFTSDDSFNSSTTFYTANSHENPLLHLTNLCDAIDDDIFQANLTNNIEEDEENEEEEDEMTLRTEQPRIILKEWEREMSEDGEEEWDETIREGIGWKGQNKEGEDEEFEEEEQLIDRDEQFGKDEQLLEEDELSDDEQLLLMNVDEPLEEVELLEADELSEHVQLIDRDKMLGGACSSSAFSLSSREGEKEQFDKNGPKTDGNTRETQKRLDDEFCAGDRGNEQKAKRKGGDRYRRRRGTAQMANGMGRKCNRRRRRVASPPQQLLNLLYH